MTTLLMKPIPLLLITLLLACTALNAAPRVALVIGNNAYRDLAPSMQLASPVNDAQDVAAALQRLGYTVVGGAAITDATREQLTAATEQFATVARGAEAAVFYFSGHGIQVGEDNYLLPSDTPKLTGLSMLKNRAVLLRDSVMVALEEAGAASKVIILDCCRDNPFSAQLETALSQVGKSVKTKSVGEISGYGPGFYLAFATSPGSTAADGNGARNSPFTAAMLKALPGGAGKDIDFFFRDVKALLPNDQVSWTNHSIKGSFALVPGSDVVAPPQATKVMASSNSPTVVQPVITGPTNALQDVKAGQATKPKDQQSVTHFGKLSLMTDKSSYRSGEAVKLTLQIPMDGYLRVYSVDASGEVTQFFPNRFETDDRVNAGAKVQLPGNNAYDLTLELPQGVTHGKEIIQAVLSSEEFLPDTTPFANNVGFRTLGRVSPRELLTRRLKAAAKNKSLSVSVTYEVNP